MAEQTMLERVARAIADADGGDYMEDHRRFDRQARSVIAAMRGPTDGMKQAFVKLALHGDVLTHGGWPAYARDQWNGMLEAALNEQR